MLLKIYEAHNLTFSMVFLFLHAIHSFPGEILGEQTSYCFQIKNRKNRNRKMDY